MNKVSVIGAGLAGCETAYKLAENGIKVDLYEQKPLFFSKAHSYSGFAELVCSNSLKAARIDSASGLLKAEMRLMNSLILESADICAVPAGGALAVDREKFSDYITQKIKTHENINIITGEVTAFPGYGYCVIATGPLTSMGLSQSIKELVKAESLSFFDAAAPIVAAESVNMNIAFAASRYERGDDDYINCPMNKEEYERFYNELINAESVELHEIDKRDFRVYEGCMPVEVLAKRGVDSIRFGPLKPVGLRDPRTGNRPWAVVQLRNENSQGTMYNLVGFQTNLKFPEQKRVFSLIPGLENAEFIRYGVMHRNTFIDSPRLLDKCYNLISDDRFYFAGQITGVEGYIESAAVGLYVGEQLLRRINGKNPIVLPRETMLGALTEYISDKTVVNFQPMGSNMGILPPVEPHIKNKKERYAALAERSLSLMKAALD